MEYLFALYGNAELINLTKVFCGFAEMDEWSSFLLFYFLFRLERQVENSQVFPGKSFTGFFLRIENMFSGINRKGRRLTYFCVVSVEAAENSIVATYNKLKYNLFIPSPQPINAFFGFRLF